MLKQSTADTVMVFMADSADHIAGKTGLTLTITASKSGAAFASISPTVTERGNGWYAVALTSSHTDTLGDLALHVTATGADPTDLACRVVAVDHASATGFVSSVPAVVGAVGSVTGAVGSVTGNVGGNVAGSVGSVVAGVAVSDKTGFSLSGAGVKALWDQLLSDTFTVNSIGERIKQFFATLGSDNRVRVSADAHTSGQTVAGVTGAVGSVTGNVGGNLAGNVQGSVASVAGAVGSVAGDVGGKVLGAGAGVITAAGVRASQVDGSVGSVSGAVGSVAGNVAGDVAGKVLGGGASALAGDGVRAASVTGAVGSVTGGVGGSVAGSVGSLGAQAKADVNAEADAALTDYGGPTNAQMEARTLTSAQVAKLVKHLGGVLEGLAAAGGSATTVPLNVLTGINGGVPSAADDFYNGAMLVWITGALAGQRTSVSDYDGTTKVLTVVAMTGAPSAGDTFILV